MGLLFDCLQITNSIDNAQDGAEGIASQRRLKLYRCKQRTAIHLAHLSSSQSMAWTTWIPS